MKLTEQQSLAITSMAETSERQLAHFFKDPRYGQWTAKFEILWSEERQAAFDRLKLNLAPLSDEESGAVWIEVKRQFEGIREQLQKN